MKTSRRGFGKTLIAASLASTRFSTESLAAQIAPWHEQIAQTAMQLSDGRPLRILIPEGSSANVLAATTLFTELSGVQCEVEVVPIDEINVELILRSAAGDTSVDVALPATFGLIDLVQAKAIIALDDLAARHEPAGFNDDYLYRKGDFYKGAMYGYQCDGDSYQLFYNKSMMENPEEIEAYRALTGKELAPATSWEDLDAMMAFFHRPSENKFGGNLFRNTGYLVWEWWARFHAKGSLPFTTNMQANINSQSGVDALNELIAASNFLTLAARANGVFENWAEFAQGNVFCNIGWGGTQKYQMKHETMRDNLIHAALPGPSIDGKPSTMGYVNWGWDYTVSSGSSQQELAYLLALFCSTPTVSTLAIREIDGYFDPVRECHYDDEIVQSVYGDSFLEAHRYSLTNGIPDLYICGQNTYLDALRQQILATINGELDAQEALDICAQQWAQITRKLGQKDQQQQWLDLLASYPAAFQ